MQRRVNPREAKRMMQRMGMSMDNVQDVTQVIIKTNSKDIIIEQPEVAILHMQGQKIFQVVGGTITKKTPEHAAHNFDITVVGSFTIDPISFPSRPHPVSVLGGSAAYISLATRRLDATASVISKVGGDFPQAYMWWLQQEGIDLSNVVRVEDEQTTRFELKYNKDLTNRTLKLKSKASPITVGDLPKSLHAKAIHIAPIAGEIAYDTIAKLKKCTEILSLDPQGLLRSFGTAGTVTCRSSISKRF